MAKFRQHLAAHSARSGELILLKGDHCDGAEITLSCTDRMRNGGAFGADTGPVSGVLNVAAGADLAVA